MFALKRHFGVHANSIDRTDTDGHECVCSVAATARRRLAPSLSVCLARARVPRVRTYAPTYCIRRGERRRRSKSRRPAGQIGALNQLQHIACERTCKCGCLFVCRRVSVCVCPFCCTSAFLSISVGVVSGSDLLCSRTLPLHAHAHAQAAVAGDLSAAMGEFPRVLIMHAPRKQLKDRVETNETPSIGADKKCKCVCVGFGMRAKCTDAADKCAHLTGSSRVVRRLNHLI